MKKNKNGFKVEWGGGYADLFLYYDKSNSVFKVLNYEKNTSEIHRLAGGKNTYKSSTGFTGGGFIERIDTLIPIGGYRVECHDGWTYGPSVMTKTGAVAIFAPTNNSHRPDKEFIPYQDKPLIARKGNKIAFFALDKEGSEVLLNIVRGDWPKEKAFTLKKGVTFFNQLSNGDWEVDFKEVQMEVYTPEPKWRPKLDLWAFFEFPKETKIPNWLYNWGTDDGPLLAKDISVYKGCLRPVVDKPLAEDGSGRTAATVLAYEQSFGRNSVITYYCASWPNDGLGAQNILREAGWTACTTHDGCGACYWKYHRGRVTAMIVGNEVEAASKKIKRLRKTEKISSEEEEFIMSSIFGSSGWDDCSLGYHHSATVSQAEWALSSREITRRLFQEFYKNLEEKILRAREAWRNKK